MRGKACNPLSGLAAAGLVLGMLGPACVPRMPEVPEERTSRIEMESVITVPEGAGRLRIWVPLPRENEYQKVEELVVEGPGEPNLVWEQREGNRIAAFHLRRPRAGDLKIKVSFLLTRRERDAFRHGAKNDSERPGADPLKALQDDRLVPQTKQITTLAARQAGGSGDSLDRARRLYEWCVANMAYDTSGEGWGRGDAVWACANKRGNCTDFHSLFVAMARSQGIPARFVMGYPLPPDEEEGEVAGYRCWAEFYAVGNDWIPVDAAEAARRPEFREYFFGRLTPHRFLISSGRDLDLEPPPKSGPVNFFYRPVVEADGTPVEEVRTVVRFRPA